MNMEFFNFFSYYLNNFKYKFNFQLFYKMENQSIISDKDKIDLNQLNSNNKNKISTELRISNLENRVNTLEKMLKFYEQMLKLREEERETNIILSNNETFSIINSKIESLENKIENIQKENNSKLNELNLILESINQRIENQNDEEIKINYRNITDNNENKNMDKNKIELNKVFTNNEIIEEIIEDKINSINIHTENKLEEVLNVIQDINKITEENEFSINEMKENFRQLQNDNIDIIKQVSIHSEKLKTLDFLISQISELKEKFNSLISIFSENEIEEGKFSDFYFSNNQEQKEEN